jgi:hypothetical protein
MHSRLRLPMTSEAGRVPGGTPRLNVSFILPRALASVRWRTKVRKANDPCPSYFWPFAVAMMLVSKRSSAIRFLTPAYSFCDLSWSRTFGRCLGMTRISGSPVRCGTLECIWAGIRKSNALSHGRLSLRVNTLPMRPGLNRPARRTREWTPFPFGKGAHLFDPQLEVSSKW